MAASRSTVNKDANLRAIAFLLDEDYTEGVSKATPLRA
jgi:hypothetical protein